MLTRSVFHLFTGIPTVSSKKNVIKKIKEDSFFENVFDKNKTLYDFGCGYGGVLYEVSKKYGCRGRGYEINPSVVFVSHILSFFYPKDIRKKVRIFLGNMYKVNLEKADIVFLFLLPNTVKKLEKKIKEECKSGTFVICNTFKFEKIEPIYEIKSEKKLESIYVYEIKKSASI